MSKTQFVEHRGNGLWAYDVAVGILLKHVIDAAHLRASRGEDQWLIEAIDGWRVVAVVSDYGLDLEERWGDPEGKWSPEQLTVFRELIDTACKQLSLSDAIPAEEMQEWDILDRQGVFARGYPEFPTAPVVELGQAISELLTGSLPDPPAGEWWFFGTAEGRSTIKMRVAVD